MNIQIRGEWWTVERARLESVDENWWGDTDWDKRRIRIDDRANGHQFVDTLIHEMIHAEFQDLKEKSVKQAATDIANALDLIGYRKYVASEVERLAPSREG